MSDNINATSAATAATAPTTASASASATPTPTPTADETGEGFVEFDRHFIGWLDDVGGSFVFSSYKRNQVIFIGSSVNKDTKTTVPSLWIAEFLRPMGLCVMPGVPGTPSTPGTPGSLIVGSANVLWEHMENGPQESHDPKFTDFDKSFVPRTLHVINDIDCHDIVQDLNGQIYFISALFGCVCMPSRTSSFKVFWSPPWQSKIAAEDRCHLNGLCCDASGRPRYVSCIARTDVRGGWRENRTNGGVIYDIIDNKLVCKDICMPHSPRWHHNRLWVLESGTGYLGYVDFGTSISSKNPLTDEQETHHKFTPLVFIPGYLRGLSFIGSKYALVGSSLDRHEKVFQDIPLGVNIKKKGVTAKCGIFIIDLDSQDVIHEVIFNQNVKDPINEIYDVCAIPGAKRVTAENINDGKLLRSYKIEQS